MTIPSAVSAIDAFELARTRGHLQGKVSIGDLPRLCESLADTGGELEYRIDGLVDDKNQPGAIMHLAARLNLACQRCNGPLDHVLDRSTRFRFVTSEDELDRLPLEDDDIDIVVGSHAMNLLDWLEDEAILSLPLVPRHDACSLPIEREAEDADLQPNPFAALAALKSAGSGKLQ